MQLNHLHLHVKNVERSAMFYARFFGFERHAVHGGGILFMRDEGGLDLALAPADRIEPMPDWFHFGFRLADGAAVRSLFGKMVYAGLELETGLHEEGDGFISFRVRDPDAYLIEVYWE